MMKTDKASMILPISTDINPFWSLTIKLKIHQILLHNGLLLSHNNRQYLVNKPDVLLIANTTKQDFIDSAVHLSRT